MAFIKKVKLRTWVLLLLIAGCSPAYPQADSLFDVLGSTASDSIRIQCYKELSLHYLNARKFDSTIYYADKGITLSKETGIRPDIGLYRLLVNANDGLMRYKESRSYFPGIIQILEQSKDPEDKARLALYKGWYLYRQGEFTASIEAFEKAKILAQDMDLIPELADAWLGLGRVYHNLGDYDLEELYYERYIELADPYREKFVLFHIISRLGDIKREKGEFKEANEVYYKLVKLSKRANDSLRTANTLNRIAWGYYEAGNLEKSLEVYQEDLELSEIIGNKNLVANCLGNIGNIYRDWNYFEKAIEYYTLSIEVSREIDDVYNLSWLYKDISAMYANMGRYEEAYKKAVLHSAYNDTLLSEDYNRRLVEARTQYEREKTKGEIELMQVKLQRNNYLIYGLGGLSLLILVIAVLFIRTNRLRSKQRLEKMNNRISTLTQKNLRAQMNPHFIFNTLNSIQYYVFQNDRIASNNYMTKFAKLIRQTLENSEQPAIPIDEEIKALELYLELESLRFKDKIEWKIDIEEDLDTYMYKIPTMLIQPYAENAIGHGLMHKEGKGYIHITLKQEKDSILCTIEDNGIGRKKAMEIKKSNGGKHKSMGTSITESRLRLVNSLYGKNMKVKYTDLKDEQGNPCGTKVEISIPIIT